MSQEAGKWMIIVGLTILLTGCLVYFAGNKLRWLGHLPGDFRIEKENFKFYFPLTTMLLLSLIASLIIRFINYIK